MSLTIDEIVALDGVIIRKIPEKTVKLWRLSRRELPLKSNERYVTADGVKLREVTTTNTLHGYIVAFDKGQGATIIFNKRRDGIGSTLIGAYENYLLKHPVSSNDLTT